MNIFIKIALLVCMVITCPSIAQQAPGEISPMVRNTLNSALEFMNRSSYDSAQFIVSRAYAQTETPVSKADLYYLHCYEAEIMYYNALFDQGLNRSLRSLEIAKQLNNDTLIGNTENLIGLFMLNLGRYTEAIDHMRMGVKMIPPLHNNDFIAYQYHALANLGECFLKLNMPDSALFYSGQAIEEANARGRNRGVALATWNMAEAWLLKNEARKADEFCASAYHLVWDSPHRDVLQTICATYMKVYEALGKPDSVYHWLELGLDENNNPLNTDLSRIQFLEQATDICIRLNDVSRGVELLKSLNRLQREVSGKQQSQRMAILKDYYEKNQRLVVADELNLAQQKELGLRKTISLVFAVLAGLMVVLLVILIITFRQRQRIARLQYNEQLQKTAQEMELKALENRLKALFTERNRIASDLHDDIGAALSSIRIYSGAAEKQFASDPAESLNLIKRINEGSTGMMERMSDIVWSINPKNDNVQSLVLRMKSHAGEILGPQDIKVKYEVDDSAEKISPSMIARRNIYLIFKEAINNIAKYSGATEVFVKLLVEDEVLVLHIDDNGRGFNVTMAQHGNGLANMSDRAKAIGGSFHISSHVGRGTQLHMKVEIAKIRDSNEG